MPRELFYKESSSSRELQMKAKEAIAKIEEIMGLEYNGYGEDIHPMEQIIMIKGVTHRYKKSLLKKESQDADPISGDPFVTWEAVVMALQPHFDSDIQEISAC